MANVSSSNGLEKRPKLRFPGFDEPLVKFEIGNACEQLKETIDPRTTPTKFYAEYSMPAFDNNRKVARVQGKDMNSARKIMSKPCVLINKLNVRKKRIWLVEHPEKNAVSSTEFVPLTSTMMSLGYLNYVALTDRFTNYMLNCSSGSSNSQKRVTPDDIMDYVITVPSLLEQVRVASFLETIDSKIQAQQDLIELLKKYKRGLISDLFCEKSTQGWTTSRYYFSEIAQRRGEKYDPSSGIEYPCVELENIEQETGKILATVPSIKQGSIKNIAKSGDTLFGKLRPYLRKYAFVQQTMACSSEIWALIPSDVVLPKFLFYLVQTDQFLRVANISSGTKMPRAEWSNIEKAEFYIPDLPVQRKVVMLLEGVDKKISFADSVLIFLNMIKAGMLQQLFI
mgnify:CR=1 FL=1